MNQMYRILTAIILIGFGFFFTTKLWNEDDRPLQNSYATSDMFNTQGRIRVEQAVYLEPNHSMDIIFEKVYFSGIQSEILLEMKVHNRDGSYYEVDWDVLEEVYHGNQTRVLANIALEKDKLDWYYIELILTDPQTDEIRNLTIDWRRVERSERLTSIYDYDLSYEFDLPSIFETEPPSPEEEEYLTEEDKQEEETHPPVEEPNWDLEILEQRLALSKEDYERVKERLEESPDDDILKQSLAFYEEEIKNLEQQIEEAKGDEDGNED